MVQPFFIYFYTMFRSMSKKSFYLLLLFFVSGSVIANAQVSNEFQAKEFEQLIRFLASDELLGRRTGSIEIARAADTLAQKFKNFGLVPIGSNDHFFQEIQFRNTTPGQNGHLTIENKMYKHHQDLLMLKGSPMEFEGEVVFVEYGWVDTANGIDDYSGIDVKDKIVLCLGGLASSNDPNIVFSSMEKKQQIAKDRGAKALFEIYQLAYPWKMFKEFFSQKNIHWIDPASTPNDLLYGWIQFGKTSPVANLKQNKKVMAQGHFSGSVETKSTCRNVIAMVQGIDPTLKEEYIIVTAHYDHVGAGAEAGGYYTDADSIFNGARDNAIGTASLVLAASIIAQNPLKRPVIFVALTGEEIGLQGSSYFVNYPPIPLHQIIFNVNTDGAGYHDTTIVSLLGFDRHNIHPLYDKSAQSNGLTIYPDPVPKQNLYDRSDNVSFAKKGIPAITISPGIAEFNEEISKYYHQVEDHADNLNYIYLWKFANTFTDIIRNIGNLEQAPIWKQGDKYEEAGKLLYSKKIRE
jgi:hypothetical protein